MRIQSEFKQKSGDDYWYYEILDDGFDIYNSKESTTPVYHQYEPFIPDPSKTYEENAIMMCADLSKASEHHDYMEERITKIESNIDYLMLLTDAESASEEETE